MVTPPSTLDSILSWGVPALLIIIAIGFVYTKFIGPWVMPMLKKMWDAASGVNQENEQHKIKEISYD